LRWLLRHEEAFQLEAVLALILLPSVYFIASSPLQASIMVTATLLVLMVEALNTAIEVVVDRISTEHHSLSGLAKDLGSLAVTLALVAWLAVWVPIVWPLITR
jgi:diacylglycerol kinase (ATP)